MMLAECNTQTAGTETPQKLTLAVAAAQAAKINKVFS